MSKVFLRGWSRVLAPALLAVLFLAAGVSGAPRSPAASLQTSFAGRDPSLRWDRSGNLHVLYVEDRADGRAVLYRRLGKSPAGPVRVSPSGLDVAAHGETPPVLEALPDGALVSAYAVALPGEWKSEIRIQRSADGGATWGEPRLLHEARDGSHSYLSAAVAPSGSLIFAWLDNRTGHMGLHTATSPDGRTFSAARTLDPESCQCCGTALLAGRGGALWLAYRALEAGDVRDIRVLRADSSASPFDKGVKLAADGWALKGCPHTGARLTQTREGALWAAWFTAAGKAGPGVYVTSSRDGGRTFAPRTFVAASARHPEIGALPDGRIAVLYEGAEKSAYALAFRLRDPRTGRWDPAKTAARQGAYPRLAVQDDKAAVAFTCQAGQGTKVVVADWSLWEKGETDWASCDQEGRPEAHGHH